MENLVFSLEKFTKILYFLLYFKDYMNDEFFQISFLVMEYVNVLLRAILDELFWFL